LYWIAQPVIGDNERGDLDIDSRTTEFAEETLIVRR